MAIYKNDTLIERPIYGSSRLGMMTASSKPGYRTLGGKKYELSNHLGNVLAVVTDNIHMDQDSTWSQLTYMTDYYPFGLEMEGRTMQDSSYRYGFNGQEKVDELGGEENHYTAKFWEYNPKTVRRWNQDPKPDPSTSNYSVFRNNPIYYSDALGDTVIAVFNKSTHKLALMDMDQYGKGLPIKIVNSSQYELKGIRDEDGNLTHNQILVLSNVFSGGESFGGVVTRNPERIMQKPIPNGNYSILDNEADTKHIGWFRLDMQDKIPYNDRHDEESRDGFRFHLGTESWGCVTCDKSAGDRSKDWEVVSKILNGTSKTSVPERRGKQRLNPFSYLKNFGTMKVTGVDKIPIQKK